MPLIGEGRRDRFPKEDVRLRRGLATSAFVPFIGADRDVDLGDHSLVTTGVVTAETFISTETTGTAPLTVSSTTVVTNLNADLLDGQHASAFVTNVTGTAPIVSSGGQTPAISITAADATHAGSVPLSGTPGTNVYLRAAQTTGTLSWTQIAYGDISGTPSLTGYVPYTGATGAVDLGAQNLTTTGAGRFDTGLSVGVAADANSIGYCKKDQDAGTSLQVENANDTTNSYSAIIVGKSGNGFRFASYRSNYTTSAYRNCAVMLCDSGVTGGMIYKLTSVGATGAITFILADDAGSSKWRIWDKNNAEQFSVNSDGTMTQVSQYQTFTRSKALTDGSATNFAEIALTATTTNGVNMVGGTIEYTITATDGTDYQCRSGVLTYAAVNKGGAITTDIDEAPASATVAASAGTLTATWTLTAGTSKVTLACNADTSLTPTGMTLKYTIKQQGTNAITAL